MGQWGKEKKVNNAVFVPLVNTEPFVKEKSTDIVEHIVLMDNGGDEEKAVESLKSLKDIYIGGKYSEWCC